MTSPLPELPEETVTTARPRRWLVMVLASVLILALVIPFVLLSQLTYEPVPALTSLDDGPLNLLIIGSDSRDMLSREEQRELSTGRAENYPGARADTIILLSIRGKDTAMLAFPRDLLVTRCDDSVGRINAAYNIGGTSCLVDTVTTVSGLPVHHTLAMTFAGVRDIVDAIGGVEVCIDEPINDRDSGLNVEAGCQRLDGAQALGFVRVRKIDDDFQRIRRQQQFIAAVAQELRSPRVFLNPLRLVRLSRAAGEVVTIDDTFGVLRAPRVARGIAQLALGNTPVYTVPATPDRTSQGAWILRLDDEAAALFDAFARGDVFTVDDDTPTANPRESNA
ncbi:MAG: LCP family protein [Nitriliruptoraceae bacterium]